MIGYTISQSVSIIVDTFLRRQQQSERRLLVTQAVNLIVKPLEIGLAAAQTSADSIMRTRDVGLRGVAVVSR